MGTVRSELFRRNKIKNTTQEGRNKVELKIAICFGPRAEDERPLPRAFMGDLIEIQARWDSRNSKSSKNTFNDVYREQFSAGVAGVERILCEH